MSDFDKIMEVLRENMDKTFVQRILNPNIFPVRPNEGGSVSTHLMSWGDMDGKYYAYPNIISTDKGLVELPEDQALSHALKTNNYIRFNSPEEADWFTKNYKKIWE